MTETVYQFLRSHGKSEASFIARHLGIQPEDCYHALVQLYDCGMVMLNAVGNRGSGQRVHNTWEAL